MTNGVEIVAGIESVAVRSFRDLLYWTDGANVYVLACDSNAGIGQRPADELRQAPTETGYSAAKVALMEVLAAGAAPFVLANTLGGPRDDYGRRLLTGIRAAIDEVDAEIALTGSDETNVPTTQTAVGVTVVGRAGAGALRLGTGKAGDAIVCVGLPKDGVRLPYTEGEAEIASLRDVQNVARLDTVHELLPVGSRGVGYEARQLAAGIGCRARLDGSAIALGASAGSSTCFLVAMPADGITALATVVRPPVTVVGQIVPATAEG